MRIFKKIYYNIPIKLRHKMEPFSVKLRRAKNSYLSRFRKLDEFPRIIQIETNSLCNGECIFCPYILIRGKKENKKMPDLFFKKVIDECSFHKVDVIYLCVMNDPLTDDRIIEFINYAKEKNPKAKIQIITNAFLLSKELSMKIINSKLDEISFSIHGWTKETYQRVMGRGMENVLKNISYFLDINTRGNLKTNIVCVNTRYFTKEDYYKGEAVCRQYNLNFGLSYLSNMADNLNTGLRDKLSIKKIRRIKLKGCIDSWPLTSIHILYDGEVVGCCLDWKREVVLGNIERESLYDIWHSPSYKDFRDKVYKSKTSSRDFLCKRCSESI